METCYKPLHDKKIYCWLPAPAPPPIAARMLAATFTPAANDIRHARSKFFEARWKRGFEINKSHMVFPVLLVILLSVLLVGSLPVWSGLYAGSAEDAMRPLQYLAILMESGIAAAGLLIAVRQKRFFGYGIFLTFAIYVFYDMARLIPLQVSDATLYPAFFVATISALWAVILIYRERHGRSP